MKPDRLNGAVVKRIELTQGLFAVVDSEDYDWLSQYRWQKHGLFYAVGYVDGKSVLMHRFIMGAKKGQQVDHINGDKLDNRRSNLRFCTDSQNHANTGLRKDNTSGFKGVVRVKKNGKYVAQIQYDKRMINLGYYETAEEAAKVYDKKAVEFFGDFARTNFSKGGKQLFSKPLQSK